METIKLGLYLIIEFCLLEVRFVATIVGGFIGAWLIGLLGGDDGFGEAFWIAFILAIMIGIAAFFLLPKTVKSALNEMRYNMDWLFHIASTIAAAVYGFFVLWPLLACFM